MSFLAPDPFPNWRKALAAAKAGTTRAVIACMGDSTTAGWYGGTPTGSSSAPLSGNAKAGSWPSQVAAMFVAGGLPFAGKQIFGDHNANSVTPTPVSAALTGYDSTLTMSTDWTVPSTTAASTCLGGHFLVGAVNTTTTIGFTDTVHRRIYLITLSVLPVFAAAAKLDEKAMGWEDDFAHLRKHHFFGPECGA